MELIFLLIGIVMGYFLNKDKVKDKSVSLKSYLVKPSGGVIDSKEVNSLNKITDDVNYEHNNFFDDEG